MRMIQRYLATMALNLLAVEVIKSIIRNKPDLHIAYIDFLYEQASHEVDRFKRLHPEKEAKDDAAPAAADQR